MQSQLHRSKRKRGTNLFREEVCRNCDELGGFDMRMAVREDDDEVYAANGAFGFYKRSKF